MTLISETCPWVQTVVTKRGLGSNCAYSKHPEVAEEEIYLSVRRAVDRIGEMKPFTFVHPLKVEIEFKKISQAVKVVVRRKGWRFAGKKKLVARLESLGDWCF